MLAGSGWCVVYRFAFLDGCGFRVGFGDSRFSGDMLLIGWLLWLGVVGVVYIRRF